MDAAVDDIRMAVSNHRHCPGQLVGLLRVGLGGWWFWDPVENASFMPWLWKRR